MGDDARTPQDFGAVFKGSMEQMARQTPAEEPFFRARLRAHFGADPSKLTIIAEKFGELDHPNVHLAVEAFTGAPGRQAEVLGVGGEGMSYAGVAFAQLVAKERGGLIGGSSTTEGPVSYKNIRLDGDRVLACLQRGVVLVRDGDARLAILVEGAHDRPGGKLTVEVLAPDHAAAEACLASIRRAARERDVYRGQVVSLSVDERRELRVRFHRLPAIARAQIILPAGVLDRIERQSIGFAAHAERLRAAGRHLNGPSSIAT